MSGTFTGSNMSANQVPAPAAQLTSQLHASASCFGLPGNECPLGPGDPNGYAAAIYVFASDITLEQNAGPSATGVAGELATAPAIHGTSALTFSASDPGAGVYEASVSVDGQVVQLAPLDDNGGRCHDVGQTGDGRPAFLYLQPCLASVSADVALDTSHISNGPHHLVVQVIDAAGNAAPVLDRQVTVANLTSACLPGAPRATGAAASALLSASWRGRRGARLLTRFGHSSTIVGRLTSPTGAPIGGATLDFVATPAYEGAQPAALASPRTGPDGRFNIHIPRGLSSRSLCLAYRSPGAPVAQSVTRTLTLAVRAPIALAVNPHTASVGSAIAFAGRLRAGPVPPAGKQLVLEARSPGSRWIEFKVVRTSRRGRFHANYRFRFPGPAQYQFRAISEPESDYPFAAGASNVVAVHER
jgi:hypothetical protein